MAVHAHANPQLPPLVGIRNVLTVNRSDIRTYDLNPFSFYINHDAQKSKIVDSKVQHFGEKFEKVDYAQEPASWVMVDRDNNWHRAQVLQKFYNADCECTGAEVSLLDSGRRVHADVEDIYPIPPEVLAAGPAQSLRVIPKGIECSSRQITELFEFYPEVKFRLTLDDDRGSPNMPHLVGVLAEVEVGYDEFLPLKQLLSDFPDDSGDRAPSTASNGHGPRHDQAVRPRSPPVANAEHNFPNGQGTSEKPSTAVRPKTNTRQEHLEQPVSSSSSSTPPELMRIDPNWGSRLSKVLNLGYEKESDKAPVQNGAGLNGQAPNGGSCPTRSPSVVAASQRLNQRPGDIDSDDDSSEQGSDSPDQDARETIRYTSRSGAVPVDVEGERQGEISMARTIENSRIVARKNQHRDKKCVNFRKTGDCRSGDLCPHKHRVDVEETLTATEITVHHKDFPSFNLRNDFVGFGVCTHVDEKGFIYMVLPYGVATVWDVLANKPNLELDFRKITQELHGRYNHQKGKKQNSIRHDVYVAVVWVDNGIRQGWYRAKIMNRLPNGCRVYLVDHGAEVTVKTDNMFHIDDDLLKAPQAIKCQLQDAEFQKGESNAHKAYEILKERIFEFRVYDYSEKDTVHTVEIIEVTNEEGRVHIGDQLAKEHLVTYKDS